MKENEYKCEMCQNIYEKGWSDEESEQEAKDIWGEIPQGDKAVICDDCYNRRTPQEIKKMGENYQSQNFSSKFKTI